MEASKIDALVRRRVRQAREEAGLTQAEMADHLALTEAGYGHYERGRSPFTVDQLARISEAVKRPIPWLLGLQVERTEDEDELLFLYRQCSAEGRATLLEMARSLAKRGL